MSIKVSEKHGVNSSLVVCFYCGEETGEIALLGKLPEDKEAPRYVLLNIEPCEHCSKMLLETSTRFLVEVSEKASKEYLKVGKYYATGRFINCTTESLNIEDTSLVYLTPEKDFNQLEGEFNKKVLH
jgi:hypothetical protein